MSFGENLINLRRQKGWSQDDLANNLNISRQAISKWENNTSKPDVDNIEKISKIFSVKIDELLNNELPNDKAVALDVKKEEKKEKTITIVKLMIIAVIILYAISVIYKFASLLVIVNGVQKYANLNNYHYVVTEYEDNNRKLVKECYYKEEMSKMIITNYLNDDNKKEFQIIGINLNENKGYIEDDNEKKEINVDDYLKSKNNSNLNSQLFEELPIEIRNNNILKIFFESLKSSIIISGDGDISLKIGNSLITIEKETLLPKFLYYYDYNAENTIMKLYKFELNKVENINL